MDEMKSVPVILDVFLTPNPAEAGEPVLISVLADEVFYTPKKAEWPCGVFPGGMI